MDGLLPEYSDGALVTLNQVQGVIASYINSFTDCKPETMDVHELDILLRDWSFEYQHMTQVYDLTRNDFSS